jgi:hypothetical protein
MIQLEANLKDTRKQVCDWIKLESLEAPPH